MRRLGAVDRLFAWTLRTCEDGVEIMDTYQVRVSLGTQWCLHFDVGHEDVGHEVVHVDRLIKVESAARAWIADRLDVDPDSFAVDLEFLRD